MSSYTQAPPGYAPSKHHKGQYQSIPQDDDEAGPSAPLLNTGPREEGDIDTDDFKFSVTVEQSAPEIRQMFLKKVYAVLFLQILGTTVASYLFSTRTVTTWVQHNQWSVIVALIGSFVSMGVLFWKRHSHPLNLGLLALFTVIESFSLGLVASHVSKRILLQALVITLFFFAGLTFFTFQSKRDFSGMGPWLYGGLMLLVGLSFIQIFFPFRRSIDMAFAAGGCLIFSGYIVYDTHMILKRLSPEEWVMAVLSLYLDIINLFLSVVRILNGANRD